MNWSEIDAEFQPDTVEEVVKRESCLRLHTFPGESYYYFVYNTVDLSVTVYKSNSSEDYMFNVNQLGIKFITPNWLKIRIKKVIQQHQGDK